MPDREPTTTDSRFPPSGWVLRLGLVIAGLAAWFGTQALIGHRPFPDGIIGDYLLDVTQGANTFLHENTRWRHGLLIVSSGIIDLLGVFLLASAVVGSSLRPFLGLLLLFSLRQICQGLCALPPPPGMIWEHPGFPSLLVTYGVSNDLFFSGHTALAVFGAFELARLGRAWRGVGIAVALFEMAAVIVLRAHWTMDVFAGAVTALLVALTVGRFAPACDRTVQQWSGWFSNASNGEE
jgi:membrane-associated phospholipid phosphatase